MTHDFNEILEMRAKGIPLQYILDELGYDQGKDTIQKVYTQAEEQGGPSIQDYFKLKQIFNDLI